MEVFSVVKWLLMCLMVSCFMRPYLRLKNIKLCDDGFSLSLSLGTAISFFVTWFIAAVTPAKFDTVTSYIVLILLCIMARAVHKKMVGKDSRNISKSYWKSTLHTDRDSIGIFLNGFAIFAILLLIFVYIKGFKPEISFDTEKYMDFGFMQGIYRQKSAIPEDIWFAGEKLNYYYLGQAMAVYLCRLSFVRPDYGYSFMICTVAALTLCMIFTMVEGFLTAAFAAGRRNAIAGGLSAAVLACFGGNGHYLIFGVIDPILKKITGKSLLGDGYSFFFPDPTVYIGSYPETMDKGKTEFLAYTLILGDLHAHAVNVIFVIPLIAILLDYSLDVKEKKSVLVEELFTDPRLYSLGFLLGMFKGSNYWDFPIYFVVSGAVILFCDYRRKGISLKNTLIVLAKGILILIIGYFIMLPFTLNFTKMASTICLAQNRSPIYKMIIIWGIQITFCVAFLAYIMTCRRKDVKGLGVLSWNDLTEIEKRRRGGELAMWAVILCAIGLVILPEIIYIKDIYGDEYARFNTMFKLTYQAFTLLSIGMGVSLGVWLEKKKRIAAIILIFVAVVQATYAPVAVRQYMGNVFNVENRKGCSALSAMYNDESFEGSAELSAIDIINDDDSEHIHIMERFGHSYSPNSRLSVFTGGCSVLGWEVHEWMWRNSWDIVADREGEIWNFYTKGDKEYCKNIIDKYDLDYILVGPGEMGDYDVNTDGFAIYCNWIPISENPAYALYKVIKD